MAAAPHLPLWALYMQAFGTIVAALIAAAIAASIQYRQWVTASDKVRLDLFDRRLKVFNAVDTQLPPDVCRNALDVIHRMREGFSGYQFLFDKEASLIILDFRLKLGKLSLLCIGVDDVNKPERDEAYKELRESLSPLRIQLFALCKESMSFVS